MALKATIHKANVALADIDRNVYRDLSLTIARHPSETDERMMLRLLALALNAPADDDRGALDFAKDLWDTDEPALWRRNLTGEIEQWIDVGQPDERRLLRAAGRAGAVSVYAHGSSVPIWWSGLAGKLARAPKIAVWQIDPAASRELASLAQRGMALQVNVQDGSAWVSDAQRSVELTPRRLGAS